jgi:hypothetical protein
VKLPVAACLRKAKPRLAQASIAGSNSDKGLLHWLSARLVADIGLTYKIELRYQLTV